MNARLFPLIRAMSHMCLAVGCLLFFSPEQAGAAGPDPAQALIAAYPEAHMVLEEEAGNRYIRIGDARLLFSPATGCPAATPDQPVDAPLCAMFSQPYPAGEGGRHPAPGFDPGRIRNEALLKALYGKSGPEVERDTTLVSFAGERLAFSTRQGAAAALARVAARLETLMRDHPETRGYILPTAGTFFWRTVKGSPRLSAHSFAIAVDLNVKKGIYWQWVKAGSEAMVERVRTAYPQAVVEAFEAEGFIWGGKWAAFDLMHFEYRPELLPSGSRPRVR